MYETYLEHHGILGQKWGIRRYQNEDGTLTEAEKKKLNSYKRKELIKTANYYNRNVRGGAYGSQMIREGFDNLNKQYSKYQVKLNKAKEKNNNKKIEKYKEQIDIVKGKKIALEKMKKMEMQKVKDMTFDQMQKEKINLGKQIAKNILISGAISAITLPTTGFVVGISEDANTIKSEFRANNFEKKIKPSNISSNYTQKRTDKLQNKALNLYKNQFGDRDIDNIEKGLSVARSISKDPKNVPKNRYRI